MRAEDSGASPSGKAAGFGPAISEVRILPPQININNKNTTLRGIFLLFNSFLIVGWLY